MLGRKKKLKKPDNRGVTLIEILIAVAIFSMTIGPLMSAFIVTARVNGKGRQTEQAMTVAQNLMEGVKGFGLAKLSEQCNTNNFALVPSNGDGTSITAEEETAVAGGASYDGTKFVSHSESSVITSNFLYEVYKKSVSYTSLSGSTLKGAVWVDDLAYTFKVSNILMGSTYYDAKITITQDNSDDCLAAQIYSDDYSASNMNSMKYYDVTIDVYHHEDGADAFSDDAHRATYTGTFLDQN